MRAIAARAWACQVTTHTINLDTNHLSDLALTCDSPEAKSVLALLHGGRAVIALSSFQMIELSAPGFKSVGEVRALLRDVPTALLQPWEEIEEEEIACAIARATSRGPRRSPRVFARSTGEWGSYAAPTGGGAVDLLDAFRNLQELRESYLELVRRGAAESMMKEQAALIRDPGLPLRLRVDRHLAEWRARNSSYGDGLSAVELIARAGGRSALPFRDAHERMVSVRLKQAAQQSTGNDVTDEYVAAYAPYVTVTAVDRRTLSRARDGGVPCVDRMTRTLGDVPEIIARVEAGGVTGLAPCAPW